MRTRSSKGTVILYLPHLVPPQYRSPDYQTTPPLPFLALGRPLRDAGYEVRLIDARWEPECRKEIVETIDHAVCLGISCLTGDSVRDGLEVAALAKTQNPEVPVIWGGWHPTFVAQQAAVDPRVDIVVRGQAERSFVAVLDALHEKRSLRGIAGLTYRDGAEIVHTSERLPEDINHFPPLDYEIVDVRRYIRVGPGALRHASTIFSRGCPFHCDFCLDSRQKWFGADLERMAAELDFWVNRWGVNELRFFDGNFFLGRERLHAICQMLINSDLAGKFTWTATGVASRMARLDGALLTQLRRAGCRQVAIGAESGSEALLAQITNKTTVAQTIEAVRLLTRHGINQYLWFMVGYPAEPAGALEDTLHLIYTLKEINPQLQCFINFCIPLPGSEMFRIAVEQGFFPEPTQFADWANVGFYQPNLPHIGPAYKRQVERFMTYLRLAYPEPLSWLDRVSRHRLLAHLVGSPVRQAARWRLTKQAFGAPLEIALYNLLHSWKAQILPTAPAQCALVSLPDA